MHPTIFSQRRPGRTVAALLAGPLLLCPALAAAETGDPSPRARMHETFAEDFRDFHPTPGGLPRWKTTFKHQDRTLPSNHELQRYVDATVGSSPFSVSGGKLDIVASTAPPGSALPYTSGLITTQESFSQRYGYFEMRAKLPAGAGLWPAFWLLPVEDTWPPEIDVVEMLGQDPARIYLSVHAAPPGGKVDKTLPVSVPATSAGFHTYGVDWQPDHVRWYFDDREVASMPTPAGLDKPMYMLINLAVGGPGSWPGPPDSGTHFPAHMLIESVHAYQ